MFPSLLSGERVVCDKRFNHPGAAEIDRGDIAVFVYPNNRTLLYIQRVIGLQGDKVDIKNTQIWVNKKLITSEHVDDLGSAD